MKEDRKIQDGAGAVDAGQNLLTIEEASRFLGIGEANMKRLVASGQVPFRIDGDRMAVVKASLVQLGTQIANADQVREHLHGIMCTECGSAAVQIHGQGKYGSHRIECTRCGTTVTCAVSPMGRGAAPGTLVRSGSVTRSRHITWLIEALDEEGHVAHSHGHSCDDCLDGFVDMVLSGDGEYIRAGYTSCEDGVWRAHELVEDQHLMIPDNGWFDPLTFSVAVMYEVDEIGASLTIGTGAGVA